MEAVRPLPGLAVALESVVGNRLGASIYRRWVDGLALAGDERVLDVGTGAGACARHLAARLRDGSLTCLDIDARWLEIARSRVRGEQVEFVVADACDWSRPAESDLVTVHFALHDIPAARRAEAVARIAENLVPGGRVCLREPTSHGMTTAELSALLADAGLVREGADQYEKIPLMGLAVNTCWRKR